MLPIIFLLFFGGSEATSRIGTQTAAVRASNEYVLAENSGLKAIARVNPVASMVDETWFEIEIINSGAPGTISRMELRVPAEFEGGGSASNLIGLTQLGIPNPRGLSSIKNVLPSGISSTSTQAGVFAAHALRSVPRDQKVTARIMMTLDLQDGRRLQTPSTGVPISFTWAALTVADYENLRKQLLVLIDKVSPGPGLGPIVTNDRNFSPRLTLLENVRIETLLQDPAVAQVVTVDQALSVVRQRQLDHASPTEIFMRLIVNRWPRDPAVIAFFRDALVTRGNDAISDLFWADPWDDSFVQAIVKLAEDLAVEPWPTQPRTDPPSSLFGRAINVLDRHYSSWKDDATIPPRLSQAVLRFYPALLGPSTQASPGLAAPGSQNFRIGVSLLAHTHDPAMMRVLLPFLSNTTVDEFGLYSANMPYGRTPLRVCELAANAISKILGEAEIYDPWMAQSASRGGPYPEWEDWDKQNRALTERVNRLLPK